MPFITRQSLDGAQEPIGIQAPNGAQVTSGAQQPNGAQIANGVQKPNEPPNHPSLGEPISHIDQLNYERAILSHGICIIS